MALAILRKGELSEDGWTFRIDIGKNRFYRYVIGNEEIKHPSGIKLISEKIHTSPLVGPLDKTTFGRSLIQIPVNLFSKDAPLVQLYSYRTKDLKGVAISDIQELKPSLLKDEDLVLPEISFSYQLNNTMSYYHTAFSSTRNVPFSYRESRMSNALFLEGIVRAVSGALPGIGNLLGPLLSGLGGGGAGTATTGGATPSAPAGIPPALAQLLNSPEVSRIIQNLLTQTLNGTATAPAAASAVAQAHSLSKSFQKYSEAKIAPALLAALPALMPLLQQVLSPETVGRVLDAPRQMVGAVTDGLATLGRVGIESHEQDLKHLRELHSVTGPPVDNLLATLSLSLAATSRLVKFRKLETVKLTFADTTPVVIEGNKRIVYSANQAISFPLIFESPGAVANAELQFSVKRPSDAKILYSKTYKIKKVDSGPIKVIPSLTLELLKEKLKLNEEYLMSAQLVWKNKKGESVGTAMSQATYLMENYIYGGTESAGEPIALNDVDKFREFWHKIWAVGFKPEKKRFKIDCRYYYILEKDRDSIGRMETVIKEGDDTFPVEVKMKSGTIFNVRALNALIPKISAHQLLSDEELAALNSDEFVNRFHAMARMGLDFNGYDRENAVLWVYPEVKLHAFILKAPAQINANGSVTGLVDKKVYFPVPSSVHFIGAKSGN